MRTLEDAWAWFTATRDGATRLARLSRYWGDLTWDSPVPGLERMSTDNRLRDLTADRMERDADTARDGLDDLAVLVLFSVFEAQVREWIAARVTPEAGRLHDPTLKKAASDALRAVEDGSFGRVLEPYKGAVGAGLVEEVNQVRRYRNWVAHGRRTDSVPEVPIGPTTAYDRLARFLAALRGSS